MMFKKNKGIALEQRMQLGDTFHSPLYLSDDEKAQLLGGFKPSVNDSIYEGIIPVPVPTGEADKSREVDNCVWYQGWNDIWRCYYYHNVETGHSQWEPVEAFVPYDHRKLESMPHRPTGRRNLRPRESSSSRSKGFTRHPTKQEKKVRRIETLIEATGCNREEAKRALKATKKDLDLAASLIIKSRKAKANTSSTQDLTENTHPDQFYCSICLDVMNDAVCCSDGHSYCKTCICNWLGQSKSSPMTNERLVHTEVIPNHALRSLISSCVKKK